MVDNYHRFHHNALHLYHNSKVDDSKFARVVKKAKDISKPHIGGEMSSLLFKTIGMKIGHMGIFFCVLLCLY